MKSTTILIALLTIFGLTGCRSAPTKKTDSPEVAKTAGIREMTPAEARPGVAAAYSQFIDVRTPEEYAAGHADRANNIPLDTLPDDLDRLEKNEPIYLICQTGRRSMKAAELLKEKGFAQPINIAGGTAAWQAAGLPMGK